MTKKVIILIGAPGSGKGTQSSILKQNLNIAHISTGDMLRAESKLDTDLGKKIRTLLAEGKLVDDLIITEMLEARIKMPDCDNGFILDGYPRTINQANLLSNLFDKYNILDVKVIEIVLDDDIIIKRILGRYTCNSCGEIYNEYFKPTSKTNICDKCGNSDFNKRTDDNLEILSKRLEVYHSQSKPILEFYQEKGIKYPFDGKLNLEQSKIKILEIIN
jgi:adenylate kinase